MTESKMKSIIRPISGTFAMQPLCYLWAVWTNTSYWGNIGPLTIVVTLFLIPFYRFYEWLWRDKN